MPPAISAIVCTCDRPEALARALESLVTQSLSPSDYEILVVDNGSEGETADVVSRFEGRARVRYARERTQGLSLARNRGVEMAEGARVAFMDDDATASPEWLERIVRGFENVRPQPGCVGGRVDAVFACARPAWLPDELVGYYSVVNWSTDPCFLGARQWLAGTNVAFDRDVLMRVGGFSPRLGRQAGRLLSMEEVAVQRRLRRRGFPIYYDPSIHVHHYVPSERLTRRWLHRRAFWQGISDAIADRDVDSGRWPWGVLAAKAVLLVLQPWSLVSAALSRTPGPRGAARECHALARAGYLAGSLRAAWPRAGTPSHGD